MINVLYLLKLGFQKKHFSHSIYSDMLHIKNQYVLINYVINSQGVIDYPIRNHSALDS